jgi:hypothetical protein
MKGLEKRVEALECKGGLRDGDNSAMERLRKTIAQALAEAENGKPCEPLEVSVDDLSESARALVAQGFSPLVAWAISPPPCSHGEACAGKETNTAEPERFS